MLRGADDVDEHAAQARVIQLDEEDALPGAEVELAVQAHPAGPEADVGARVGD